METTDEDSVNTLIAEDRRVRKEERGEKNRILSIHNHTRKQAEWEKHIGITSTADDNYLEGDVF